MQRGHPHEHRAIYQMPCSAYNAWRGQLLAQELWDTPKAFGPKEFDARW